MTEQKDVPGLSYFDRAIGSLHGRPEAISTRATTMRVVPPLGFGSHVYVVQTYRVKEEGDTIFIENLSDAGTMRIVIPPSVADTIARQRDQLTTKSRSRAGKARADDMRQRGIAPGFMRGKK